MKAVRGKGPVAPSIRLYHRISLMFVVVSFLLLVLVLYLSISKAIVEIVPVAQAVKTDFPVRIVQDVDEEGEMSGYVFERVVERSRTFTLPQENAQPVEAKATGTVTLVNETNAVQPLVATTRLLSAEGVLFRLDKPVTVPANGYVDTTVSADAVGKTGEIGPTRFTLPGLNADKQRVIYAVSVDNMTGGVRFVRPLRDSDITAAAEELKTQLAEEAKKEWQAGFDTSVFDRFFAMIEVQGFSTDVPAGTETGVFTLSMKAKVRGIAYPSAALQEYAAYKLNSALPAGMRLRQVNYDATRLEVKAFSAGREEAEVAVMLDGMAVIDVKNDLLKTERLAGKSVAEVKNALNSPELIQNVNVRFIPAWLKRMPTLPDHIEVRIGE